MTILDPADGYFTLINTFTVEPEKAPALLAHLSAATEQIFCKADGFVSANLHLSDDSRHIANYAQWRSRQDYAAAVSNPETQRHMADAAALATSFSPLFYALREVHAAKRPA